MLFYLFGAIPVIWLALLLAQSLGGGLPELLRNLTAALEQPTNIIWTDSPSESCSKVESIVPKGRVTSQSTSVSSYPCKRNRICSSLFIWVLSLVMILTVYGRFFKLYMATAIAPIPLQSFAGQPSSSIGMAFIKSHAAICHASKNGRKKARKSFYFPLQGHKLSPLCEGADFSAPSSCSLRLMPGIE